MEINKQPAAIICLSPYNGGMELDAISLSKKLAPYMKTLNIVKERSFMHEKLTSDNNIAFETINFYKSFSLSIILGVRKIVKEHGIKNIIFFGASELKSLYFAFLGLDINLIIRHGTTKSRPKKDWFHKLIYSDVNYHISICKHLQNNVDFIIPFAKKTQSKLIYSSFDFKKPIHKKQDKLSILHVGRVADGKGQTDAIKACEILVQNSIDFNFNIVGGFDESYKNEFLNFYESCSYKEKITLIGFSDNVKSYIEKSDIFLFPSYGEGLSNAFMEAISNNVVCLSYNNTSFPELQDLNVYFTMAKDRDISDLQTKLLQITTNIKEEKEKSSQNNTLVKELFSLEKEMSSYLEILI